MTERFILNDDCIAIMKDFRSGKSASEQPLLFQADIVLPAGNI